MAKVVNNICVYQHRRLDNNEIFYIGIGNLKRPYKKQNRSKFWNNIVNKTEYTVEILFKELSKEEACNIEKYLIKFYGRKDLGLGNLVNMTDGGDGMINLSNESKFRISKANIGNKYSLGRKRTEEYKLNASITRIGKKTSQDTKRKISEAIGKLILNTQTGIFYNGCKSASIAHNINMKTLSNQLNGISPNKTNLIFVEDVC